MKRIADKINIFLILGAVYMVTCNGCSEAGRYSKYSSVDPELNITMDYVSGWQFSETRGANNSYANVFFGEPENKAKEETRRTFVSVTAAESSAIGIIPATIEAAADDLLGKMLKLKESRSLSRAKIKIPAGDAIKLDFSYKGLDKIYTVGAKLISIRESIVIFKNGDRVYTVRCASKEEDFGKFERNFDHMVKSIRFKEKS